MWFHGLNHYMNDKNENLSFLYKKIGTYNSIYTTSQVNTNLT